MKGKLILLSIDKPVEGMQVVLASLGHPHPPVRTISLVTGTGVILVPISEIGAQRAREWDFDRMKQIVVEYEDIIEDPQHGHALRGKIYIPLHPDDWDWAIDHIEEEIDWVAVHSYDGAQLLAKRITQRTVISPTRSWPSVDTSSNTLSPLASEEVKKIVEKRFPKAEDVAAKDKTQKEITMANKPLYTEEEVKSLILDAMVQGYTNAQPDQRKVLFKDFWKKKKKN